MVEQMDPERFGSCMNTLDCEATCTKEISLDFISETNADSFRAVLKSA